MLQIVRISERLPADFEILRQEAQREGWHHLDRLAREFETDGLRFEGDGEGLLAIFEDGVIAGIGVVCTEPNPADGPARRMRRFYIRPQFRGRGIGRTLANALMQQGRQAAPLLTVHAGKADAARFWERMGFGPDNRNGWSHSVRDDRA